VGSGTDTAIEAHFFDVELYGFADQLPGLFQCFAGCYAPRQIRDVGAEAGGGFEAVLYW
jgi:hypothetical protein